MLGRPRSAGRGDVIGNGSGAAPVPVDGGAAARDRPPRRWYVRIVRRYIGAGPYLDFGCGPGHLLRHLAEHGSASGFEVSDHSAALARRIAPGCPVHSSLGAMPTGVYRGITAVQVLQHLDDDSAAAALACWRRVLVPGGRALVAVPDRAGRARRHTGDAPAVRRDHTHTQWRQFFHDEGFTVVREGSDGMWKPPYGSLPRPLDAAVHAVPAALQFLGGRLLARPGAGESSVFVIRAPAAQ